MDRVAKENVAMLKRLEKVEPIYKVTDWIDDWRKKQELTERITAYPNEYQVSRPVVSWSTHFSIVAWYIHGIVDHQCQNFDSDSLLHAFLKFAHLNFLD